MKSFLFSKLATATPSLTYSQPRMFHLNSFRPSPSLVVQQSEMLFVIKVREQQQNYKKTLFIYFSFTCIWQSGIIKKGFCHRRRRRRSTLPSLR